MALIQRVGDWTLDHPDVVISAIGFVWGFLLAYRQFTLFAAIGVGVFTALFTLSLAWIRPHDNALGPHQ